MTARRTDPPGGDAATAGIGKSGWVVIGALMLATVLANTASVCMFPQIVALSEEFGRPVNEVVWTMAGFYVVATGVGGVAAALGAIVGNRRMLTIALSLLFVGCLLAALSTNLSVLVTARVIQGVSLAVQALSVGIVANYWRGENLRRAMSMIVLAMGLGAVIAYLLSGLIWRSGGDWRTMFWILTAASAIDLVLTVVFIKETKRFKGVRVDYAGCFGLVIWSVLLLVPLSQANSWGWGSTRLLGMLLPGVVVLVLWVLWEVRRAAPLVNLRVLKQTGGWQGGVVWMVIALSLLVPAAAVPYLFQTPVASGFGFGQSMWVVSLALALPALVMSLVSPLASSVMRRLGAKRTMLLGVVFSLFSFGLAFAHGSIWATLLWMAVIGIGPGLGGPASYAVSAEAVAPERGIQVSTIYNTITGTGCTIAAAVVGYVLTIRQVAVDVTTPAGIQTQLFPANETFTWSALIIGVAGLAGLACVLSIRTSSLRADPYHGGAGPASTDRGARTS